MILAPFYINCCWYERKLSELENQIHFNEKKLSAEGSEGKISALKVASLILGKNTTPHTQMFPANSIAWTFFKKIAHGLVYWKKAW